VTEREVWIAEPGRIELRSAEQCEPDPGEVRVRIAVTGISPGTELLAFRGQLPEPGEDEAIDPHSADGSYPMRTGYCAVGRLEALGACVDPGWKGRRVFLFHPHGTQAVVPHEKLIPIPDAVSDELATFIPNLETALGLVMDARPGIGERFVVLGQGIVGLLVTRLLSRFPLELLAVADPVPERRTQARESGAEFVIDPGDPDDRAHLERRLKEGTDRTGADAVLELSGNPAALNDAISLAGYGGRIIAGSWYGDKPAELDLGGRFHRNRISLASSQVSTIAPELTGRWTKRRRMDEVMRLLPESGLEPLITHRLELDRAMDAFELLDQHPDKALQVLLTCNENDGSR
jgi:2-desacetyl-2-hydroxyethyl bacteriochlorophyllide A dehydrogenase